MQPLNETRERFLTAIAAGIPGAGAEAGPAAHAVIEELHLFPPIRQGGTESGVAVVAVSHSRALTSDPIGAEGAAEHVDPRAERAAENTSSRAERAAEHRLTVYTARYRLTLKGPDRGKWEFTMHAEADAPLVTVDKVVRGVQQRSGDVDPPWRLSGEEFREAVAPRTGA